MLLCHCHINRKVVISEYQVKKVLNSEHQKACGCLKTSISGHLITSKTKSGYLKTSKNSYLRKKWPSQNIKKQVVV